jgi:probable HAF family extracellular repeat protein
LLGLNDVGQAAGYATADPNNVVGERAFVHQPDGTFTFLTFPAGTGNSQATGINNAGVAVGFFVGANGVNHGFLQNGMKMTVLDVPGSTFTQALGINNLGQVAGVFMNTAGTHGFVYTNGTFQTVDAPLGMNKGMTTTTANGINDQGLLVGFFEDGAGNTNGFIATPDTLRVTPATPPATPPTLTPAPPTLTPAPTPMVPAPAAMAPVNTAVPSTISTPAMTPASIMTPAPTGITAAPLPRQNRGSR